MKIKRLILALSLAAVSCVTGVSNSAFASSYDCAIHPDTFGTACTYPSTTTTGVPSGTSLTATGSMTVTTSGTSGAWNVIDAKDITGTLTINANYVLVKRTRITATGTPGSPGPAIVVQTNPAFNIQFQDVEIVGDSSTPGSICLYGGGQYFRAIRMNIHHCQIEVQNTHTGSGSLMGDSMWIEDSVIGPSVVYDASMAQIPNGPYVGLDLYGTSDVWPSKHNTINGSGTTGPTGGYGIQFTKTSGSCAPFIALNLISGGTYNVKITCPTTGGPYTPKLIQNRWNKYMFSTTDFVTRNSSVATTQAGYGDNYDDHTDVVNNASL